MATPTPVPARDPIEALYPGYNQQGQNTQPAQNTGTLNTGNQPPREITQIVNPETGNTGNQPPREIRQKPEGGKPVKTVKSDGDATKVRHAREFKWRESQLL